MGDSSHDDDDDEARPGRPVEARLVRELAQILADTDLTEIEIKSEGMKIRLARQMTVVAGSAMAAPAAPLAATPRPAPVAAQADIAPQDHPGAVKSPMVGTCYLRPNPAAKAFVEIGDQVKAGDKLLLVEAMKTFNDIVAPRAGAVTAILVDDGQPVEYGQTLLVIE